MDDLWTCTCHTTRSDLMEGETQPRRAIVLLAIWPALVLMACGAGDRKSGGAACPTTLVPDRAERDAAQALKHGDHSLLGLYGYGINVPGAENAPRQSLHMI